MRRWLCAGFAVAALSSCGFGQSAAPAPTTATLQYSEVDQAVAEVHQQPGLGSLPADKASQVLKGACAGHLAGVPDSQLQDSLKQELAAVMNGETPSADAVNGTIAAARKHLCP